MIKHLQTLLHDPALTYTETLQALWSGYGEIARYYSPKLTTSVIVKSVSPPKKINHPRGWHSSVGHARKLASYKVEACFYQHYARYCPPACYVPQMIAFTTENDTAESQTLVIEDLLHAGFDDNEFTLALDDIKVVIRWLANFHGKFLGNAAEGLWETGSYWYLATRQNEYNKMQNCQLKKAASFIDDTLNNARYKTIIHGDAKIANFCFGAGQGSYLDNASKSPLKQVAAVDFQYVGKGVGVKDLAYFLGSCLIDSDLTSLHAELLDDYFDTLSEVCQTYQPNVNFSDLEQEWRKLYAFSCADFHRFLLGWSPEHHKINPYLQSQTDQVLKQFME